MQRPAPVLCGDRWLVKNPGWSVFAADRRQKMVQQTAESAHRHQTGHASPDSVAPLHREILDLLLHLAPYHRDPIVVIGPPGSGKTTLIRRFVERAHRSWKIAVVSAAAASTSEALWAEVNHQFQAGGDGGPDSGVHLAVNELESHLALPSSRIQRYIVVIDEAHRLPPDTAGPLQRLVRETRQGGLPLTLVLVGEPAVCHLPLLKSCPRDGAGFLYLDPLDLAGIQQFFAHWWEERGVPGKALDPAQLHAVWRKSNGSIAALNDLAHRLAQGETIETMAPDGAATKPRRAGTAASRRRWVPPVVGVICVLALSSAVYGLLQWFVAQDTPPAEQAPAPPVAEPGATGGRFGVATGESESAPVPDHASDTTMQPPSPPSPTPSAAVRVMAGSDMPAPPPIPMTAAASPPDSGPLVEHAPEPSGISIGRAEPPVMAASEPVVSADVTVTAAMAGEPGRREAPVAEKTALSSLVPPPPPATDDGLRREAWIMAQPPEAFTLQLIALRREDNVINVLKNAPEDGPFAYYRVPQEPPLFAVIYGVFTDRAAAEAMAGTLPPALRRYSPWIRPFKKIQQEIQAVGKNPS